jgi:hypothetical protein
MAPVDAGERYGVAAELTESWVSVPYKTPRDYPLECVCLLYRSIPATKARGIRQPVGPTHLPNLKLR